MSSMGDYNLAIRQRNAINKFIMTALAKYRPLPRIGSVVAIDRVTLKADVSFPGSDATLECRFARGQQPRRVGSVVVVEGRSGDYRITQCTDESFSEFDVPVAGILVHAHPSAAAPAGYLLCDGSFVDQVLYARLFEAIGFTYATDPGDGTFKLPSMSNFGTNLRYIIKT